MKGRTFTTSDGVVHCDECCNKDGCDDPSHKYRPNGCEFCGGTGLIPPMADRAEKCAEEKDIQLMVDRFLGWKLPENFNPDGGISFKREFNEHTPWPMKHEPTGTNLLDATQARAMLEYVTAGFIRTDENGAGDGEDKNLDTDICLCGHVRQQHDPEDRACDAGCFPPCRCVMFERKHAEKMERVANAIADRFEDCNFMDSRPSVTTILELMQPLRSHYPDDRELLEAAKAVDAKFGKFLCSSFTCQDASHIEEKTIWERLRTAIAKAERRG